MNSANDKYGSSLDRPLGSGKPVDPATRLSELLAQSLEELTRPFDPPRPGPHAARSVAPREDADKALAELEAELFAAAQQVDRDESIPHAETEDDAHAREPSADSEPQ